MKTPNQKKQNDQKIDRFKEMKMARVIMKSEKRDLRVRRKGKSKKRVTTTRKRTQMRNQTWMTQKIKKRMQTKRRIKTTKRTARMKTIELN